MKKKHIMFAIDDATGELLQNFDTSMTRLLTCNEHGKSCCIWICIHSAKRVLPPLARQMLNYLFLYKVTNAMLLKSLWEEYFSMQYDRFDEFKQIYLDAMETDKNAIMFALSGQHELDGITSWSLINTDYSSQFAKKKDNKKKEVIESESDNKVSTKKSFIPFFLKK